MILVSQGHLILGRTCEKSEFKFGHIKHHYSRQRNHTKLSLSRNIAQMMPHEFMKIQRPPPNGDADMLSFPDDKLQLWTKQRTGIASPPPPTPNQRSARY